jgi:hypothetical protein
MSREMMQALKNLSDIDYDKEEYNYCIRQNIETFYSATINTAMNSSRTSYVHELINDFTIDNLHVIIPSLKNLFPGCIVKHAIMASDNDGKLYDISELSDDDLKKVQKALNNSYIVIDWS